MFGFVAKSEVITPKDGTFWSSWFNTVRGIFFAKGPSVIGGGIGGGTGLSQGPGTQGNFGAGPQGAFSALQLPTVWACLRLLAEIVASLPPGVYKRTADGGRDELRDHPLWELLHDQPNPFQTRVEWLEQQMLNILTDGNCYDLPQRVGDRVFAINPLSAAQMDVDLHPNGTLKYTFHPDGAQPKKEYGKEIVQVRLFGNGLKGLSPLGYARSTLMTARLLQDNAATFAAKGNKGSGVLMVDHVFKPGQRDAVRENFKELEQNNQRLFVLEAGFKYQQLTITPEDAQMIEQLKLSVQDICRIYRVPSFMVNDSEKATTWGSGLEQLDLAFLKYTLRPYLTRFEQAWNTELLTREERAQGIYIEFNLDALLRADSAGRAAFYASMGQNGAMTRNEIRRKENLPASDDENADKLTVQSNLTLLDKLGAEPKPAAPTAPVENDKPPIKLDMTMNVPEQKAADVKVDVAAPVVHMAPVQLELKIERDGQVSTTTYKRDPVTQEILSSTTTKE